MHYEESHTRENNVKVTRKHGYRYLKEIVVRRADNDLYRFKEGDFPRLRINDIEDMLLLVIQNRLTNLSGDELSDFAIALRMFTRSLFSDRTLTKLRTSLDDITKNIRMEYLAKRRWCTLEKKRANIMIKAIDKQLKERRYEKRSKSENKGKVPTEMELVLEQTQQCTSYEVSVDPYGFEGTYKDGRGDYYSEDQYAVSIKEDTAYPCLHSPKTTEDKAQYAVSRETQYVVFNIWKEYNILEDIKRGPYSKKSLIRLEYGVSTSIGYGVSSSLSNTAYSLKLINTAYPLPLDTAYRSSGTEAESWKYLSELNMYHGTHYEDVVDHIAKVLKMVDLIYVPGVDSHQLRMKVFPLSLADDAKEWWISDGEEKITTWEELVEKFFFRFYLESYDGEDEMLDEGEN
ncbi:hypothetical protein Tco_1459112 [Tanacetum coccineum]